jgi:cell division septal protein FtsQ
MRVKAPAEKNFRRSRVRPGSRKGGTGLLRWVSWRLARYALAMVVIAYAGYTATTLVLHASALQVRRISVHGNVRISSGEVKAIVDGLRGTSIITADLPGYRRRLMESPWIADVALRRVLPSTVDIFVSERRPVGLCRLGSALYLIDPSGTLIDEFGPQYAEFDLPIIDGLVAAPNSGQPTIDPARAELAARVIEAVAPRKDIAQRVSQIDVRDAHDAIVMLQDDVALLHLGEDKFLERLQSYVDLAPALREQVSEIDYVDLRFGERVYVRPAAVKR